MNRTPVWYLNQKNGELGEAAVVPLGATGRLVMIGLFAIVVALPIASRWLMPNADGFGTHMQMGLPACYSRQHTGINCPTCGMTTASAWLSRGEIKRAWSVQPAMIFLWLLAILVAIWSSLSLVKGRLVGFCNWDRPLALWAWGMLSVALMTWGIRIYQWQMWVNQ
jgi:hypothetical protein